MIDPLFGKYCYIDTPWIAGKHTIYRIIRSGVRSNSWCEVPVNGRTEKVNHGEHSEEIVFVMLDTLIDENTKIMRFALKDVEIIEMADRKTEPSDSEKPNNCEAKNYCDDCLYTDTCDSKEFFYACTSKATREPKTEPTWEQVKEYCNKRCLDIVDSAMRKQWYKTEPITHDDYIESGNDHLEARCLNCNNAKACKEKHWEGCVYEPKTEPQTVRSNLESFRVDEPQTDCAWGRGEEK